MTSGRCRLHFEGAIVSGSIGELQEEILPFALHCPEVEVDLSGVSEMDNSGLELMLLAKRVANGRLRFVGHSQPILNLFEGQILQPTQPDSPA